MQLAETRAVHVALVLRVGGIAKEVTLAFIIELFLAFRNCSGRRRDTHPFVVG